jgi:hypothetical protein
MRRRAARSTDSRVAGLSTHITPSSSGGLPRTRPCRIDHKRHVEPSKLTNQLNACAVPKNGVDDGQVRARFAKEGKRVGTGREWTVHQVALQTRTVTVSLNPRESWALPFKKDEVPATCKRERPTCQLTRTREERSR